MLSLWCTSANKNKLATSSKFTKFDVRILFVALGEASATLMFALAERKGFEPSIRFCRIHAFQACAFDHSATSLSISETLKNKETESQITKNILAVKIYPVNFLRPLRAVIAQKHA